MLQLGQLEIFELECYFLCFYISLSPAAMLRLLRYVVNQVKTCYHMYIPGINFDVSNAKKLL